MRELAILLSAVLLFASQPSLAQKPLPPGPPPTATAIAGGAVDSTTVAGRALSSILGDVVNTAACDGVTDDAAAFNTVFAAIRARSIIGGSSLSWPIGRVGKIRLAGILNQCMIKSTLNMTQLYGSGTFIDFSGITLLCQTNGTPCVDATGMGQGNISNLNINGSSTRTPNLGLVLGRITNNGVGADHNYLDHPTITGSFTLAPFLNESSETTLINHGWFSTNSANAYGMIFDGLNHFAFQSAFTGQTLPTDTLESFNENTCIECVIEIAGANTVPLWIGQTARHKFINGYILYSPTTSAPGPGIQLYFGNNAVNDLLDLDIHFEDQNMTPAVQFIGSATPLQKGLRMRDETPFQSGPLFGRGSGVTSVTIQDADFHIAKLGGNTPSWFDTPSAYNVSGYVYSGDATWQTPGSFSGTVCAASTCTANLNFASLTATSVSATTIAAGTFQGGVFSNPGSVTSVSLAIPIALAVSYWNSSALTGSLPTYALNPVDGNGGGGTVALSNIVLYGYTGATSGGVGCSVGDTFNVIDPQSGGNLTSGGTLVLTATAVTSGAPTAMSIGSTTGNAFLWRKPMSASTAITSRTSTCTTLPSLVLSGGYPNAVWAAQNGQGSLQATLSVTNGGSGYTAIPVASPSVPFTSAVSQGTGIAPVLSSSQAYSAGLGKVVLNGTGTVLGVTGSGGAPVILAGAVVDQSATTPIVLTTSGYTIPSNISRQVFKPASQLASATVTLPACNVQNFRLSMSFFTFGVTALTLSPTVVGWANGNPAPADTAAIAVICDTATSTWHRD